MLKGQRVTDMCLEGGWAGFRPKVTEDQGGTGWQEFLGCWVRSVSARKVPEKLDKLATLSVPPSLLMHSIVSSACLWPGHSWSVVDETGVGPELGVSAAKRDQHP